MLAGDIFLAGPTPLTRPKDVPFLHVQNGPSGPSAVKGMRSLSAAEAFDVNRSGGMTTRRTVARLKSVVKTRLPSVLSPVLRDGSSCCTLRLHGEQSRRGALHELERLEDFVLEIPEI
jgi:hypothetical protein